MERTIRKVAVVGAGTMGAGIAGVSAAAGCDVVLLDLDKNVAQKAIERLTGGRNPVLTPEQAARISVASSADELDAVADCDWICEAIVENLAIKRDLFSRLEAVRKDGSILTTNTSGIPLRDIYADMPERLQRDIAVTHFFNPVHIMRLLELVLGEHTSDEARDTLVDFCGKTLGKGVVYAKDTVNFIGNRIGCFWMLAGLHVGLEAQRDGLKMEEIDALMGKPIGLPPTGLYGLIDLIGLDVMDLVGKNLDANLTADDRGAPYAKFPATEQSMLDSGQLGRKTGGGFYRMLKDADGNKSKEVYDLLDKAWRPAVAVELPEARMDLSALLYGDSKASEWAWKLVAPTLCYAAELVPEIADDIVNVDRAMRWGFNWAQGPFEMIDALGPQQFADKLKAQGEAVPALLEKLIQSGESHFYSDGKFFGVDGQKHDMPAE